MCLYGMGCSDVERPAVDAVDIYPREGMEASRNKEMMGGYNEDFRLPR